MVWLVTGKGTMLDAVKTLELEERALEEKTVLPASEKIRLLELQVLDKDKIIKLLEQQIKVLENNPS
ncbi:MAG: hypothetical protein H7Y04_12170 [Verrucomicrobia bacterium]|nr:hypothetical protein [Cytophagales bacterium]